MELPGGESANGEPGPYRAAIVGKLARSRHAQQDGLLDAAWDPIDIMALVSQIAPSWSDQAELAALAPRTATDATVRSPSDTIRTASSLNSGENCLRRLVTYLPLPYFCQLMQPTVRNLLGTSTPWTAQVITRSFR
jgi:hypothetical protein